MASPLIIKNSASLESVYSEMSDVVLRLDLATAIRHHAAIGHGDIIRDIITSEATTSCTAEIELCSKPTVGCISSVLALAKQNIKLYSDEIIQRLHHSIHHNPSTVLSEPVHGV